MRTSGALVVQRGSQAIGVRPHDRDRRRTRATTVNTHNKAVVQPWLVKQGVDPAPPVPHTLTQCVRPLRVDAWVSVVFKPWIRERQKQTVRRGHGYAYTPYTHLFPRTFSFPLFF